MSYLKGLILRLIQRTLTQFLLGLRGSASAYHFFIFYFLLFYSLINADLKTDKYSHVHN
jgi:hypothetical protein